MAKIREVEDLERISEPTSDRQPVLTIGLGRGQTGKSVAARWMIDRARNAGRSVIAADGDRTNQTLNAFYSDAVRPQSAEDADLHEWFTAHLERMATERVSMVLDLGGGDRVLEGYAREVPIVEFCDEFGIKPVCAYFVAANVDSLAPVAALEASGAFKSQNTILVLNEGLIPVGQDMGSVFDAVKKHAVFRSVLDRGAEVVVMPRLAHACMRHVEERRLHFFDADSSALGPVRSVQVKHWLRAVEEAFAPVKAWLP